MRSVDLRASRRDGHLHVDLLIDHPMEPGSRRDAQGRHIPAWYLLEIVLRCDERTMARWLPGRRISRNPVLSLQLIDSQPSRDAHLSVEWRDSRGESGSAHRTLAAHARN